VQSFADLQELFILMTAILPDLLSSSSPQGFEKKFYYQYEG
jgi:hypothetical protein